MKVLLADDHALFREGMGLVLENLADEPVKTVEAADYAQALEAVRKDPGIEIALVDLNMPGMDGFAGIEALRRAAPDLVLVVVSASTNPRDVRRALECGAQGYITKNSSSSSMMEGIRAVLAGERFVSPGIESEEAPESKGEPDTLPIGGDALTPRQRDVLSMLRQGKSNKEIARDLSLAEITVKLHVTAILRTLKCENRTQAAILATRMGI